MLQQRSHGRQGGFSGNEEEQPLSSSSTAGTTTTINSTSNGSSSSNLSTPIVEEQERKTLLNVYDLYSIKYTLDSAVRSILLEEKGFKEDTTLSNIKLMVGFLACGGAIAAYFTKNPLYALFLCIAYVSVIFSLTLNGYFFEQGSFLLAYSMQYGYVRIESDVYDEDEEEAKKRNCPKYQITVHFPSPTSLFSKYKSSNSTVYQSWYVNDLFDEYGAFDKKEVRQAINDLIKRKGQ